MRGQNDASHSVGCGRHPQPRNVWPVRISAGAFGPGSPRRALLLSADHAVYVQGVLVPVRYLINGATIVQQPVRSVSYWHVELDRHNVILAEGLPCETYLDTGNRGAFANGGAVVQAHPDFAWRTWETKACAPLLLDGPRLAAIKTAQLARARQLGHTMTDDPDLHMIVDGRPVRPSRDGGTFRFTLPPDGRTGRLTSRRFVPAHIAPDSDDHRPLGVAVSALRVDGHAIPLDDPQLTTGWHAPEPNWRWTGGDAAITLAGARDVTCEVALTGKYWRQLPATGLSRTGLSRA